MKCVNCHQYLDEGAKFCGNCGTPVGNASNPQYGIEIPQGVTNASNKLGRAALSPPYKIALESDDNHELKAIVAIVISIISISAVFIYPVIGFLFGVGSLVFATWTYSISKHKLSFISIFFAVIAVLSNGGVGVYLYEHNITVKNKPIAAAVQTSSVSTPCYYLNFVDTLNVSNQKGSCSLEAYNGTNFNNSTEVYKIVSEQSGTLSPLQFDQASKAAIEKDINANMSDFSVVDEGTTTFSASPAYQVSAFNKVDNVSVVEESVLHQTSGGSNIFVIIHALNGSQVDLNNLQSEWQWK